MGAHVPSVREQRHRVEGHTRRDFHHHHRGGNSNHQPGPTFSDGGIHREIVRMPPITYVGSVHISLEVQPRFYMATE